MAEHFSERVEANWLAEIKYLRQECQRIEADRDRWRDRCRELVEALDPMRTLLVKANPPVAAALDRARAAPAPKDKDGDHG